MNLHERLALPLVEADLARFEELLSGSVLVGEAYLDSITTHLINAGGKRLRPTLAIASATSGARAASEEVLLGGVCLELVHLASLYHDDVLDEASVRRNVDSVNARYGNLIAIVAGDYLMARSAGIAADLGTDVAGLLARTLADLTRGQISEVRTAFSVERTEEDYYEAIVGKTASLLSTSCRIGAMTAHLDARQADALADFGRNFGMVYQLRDDVMDLVAIDDQLGKPAGQDLAEGIYNLPTLFALRDPVVGAELAELLGAALDDHERERARKLVVATDGVAQTVSAAHHFVVRAHASLAELPDQSLRDGFGALISSLVEELPA
ncbi:MAG TPA: polyprenyl synthetase family protein [Acidimicrobiales bacterium]|nr:polyprenyl synthetase family protein [Acidimicrobiales bacterium]